MRQKQKICPRRATCTSIKQESPQPPSSSSPQIMHLTSIYRHGITSSGGSGRKSSSTSTYTEQSYVTPRGRNAAYGSLPTRGRPQVSLYFSFYPYILEYWCSVCSRRTPPIHNPLSHPTFLLVNRLQNTRIISPPIVPDLNNIFWSRSYASSSTKRASSIYIFSLGIGSYECMAVTSPTHILGADPLRGI